METITVNDIVNPHTALDELIDESFKEPVKVEEPQEEPVEELEAEVEDSVEEPQESQTDEDPEIDKIYLNDFADDTGTEVADVYELSVKIPHSDDMTISELKNFKIDNADIDQIRLDLKNREEDLQVRSDEMRDVPTISNELMQARAQVLSIQDQYNHVNWDEIRQSNPAEWSARQQEFHNAFQVAKDNEARATETVDTQQAQARSFQQDRLFEAMPELKDDALRAEAGTRVAKFAGKYGFSAKDVANIEDSRLMRMLIDVSKLDVASVGAKKKLDKTPPKATKPQARRMPSTRKASLKRLKDKAAGSGSREDINAFIDAALT